MLRNSDKRHRVPELNTTSTADISFMLLTFFLVTTSMDTDKGLRQQLPPMPQETVQTEMEIKRRNVMLVAIGDGDKLTCDGKEVTMGELRGRVKEFVDNKANNPEMPEKIWRDIPLLGHCAVTADHLISLRTDRKASYNAYFGIQNTIAAAYNDLRNALAERRFGHPYAECTAEQREAVRQYYPQRISETELDMRGGGR